MHPISIPPVALLLSIGGVFVAGAGLMAWNLLLVRRLRRAETRYRERSGAFRSFFFDYPLPVLMIDRGGLTLLEVNDVALLKFGWKRRDLLRTGFLDLLPDEDQERFEALLAGRGGELEGSHDIRLTDASGEVRDFKAVFHRMSYFDRPAVLALLRDQTAEKRAEAALVEGRHQVQNLIDNAGGILWSVDREGRTLAINSLGREFMKRVYGEDPPVGDFASPMERAEGRVWKEWFTRCLKGESIEVVRESGGIPGYWHEVSIRPMFGMKGGIEGVVAFSRDVSDRMRQEKTQRQQAERLRWMHEIDAAILGALDVSLLCRNALAGLHGWIPCDGAAIYLVEAEEGRMRCVAHTGFRLSEGRVVGESIPFDAVGRIPEKATFFAGDARLHPRIGPLAEDLHWPRSGSYFVVPLLVGEERIGLFFLFDASTLELDANDRPLLQSLGDHLAVALRSARLAEEWKNQTSLLETRVRERTAHLETALEELDAFSYSVSHDLKSPLRSINGFARHAAELLESGEREEARDSLDRVARAASQMEHLLESLLVLGKVSRAPLVRRKVDLSALAEDVRGDLEGGRGDRVVEWRIEAGLFAMGDEGLLRSLLENLLGNAYKFTSEEDHALIEVVRDSEEGFFQVIDNGVGFDMTYATRLFQPFQRFHSARRFPGTGVGLSIVARIVQRHGGELTVRSEPGKGARFRFSLGPSSVKIAS